MKILLISLGSRGDIEPFLAVADLMKSKGHHTVCLFPEQFRAEVLNSGHQFESLGEKFLNLIYSESGKTVMGGTQSGIKRLFAYVQVLKFLISITPELIDIQKRIIDQQKPERIIHHATTFYAILWGILNPGKSTLICPIPFALHAVDHRPYFLFKRSFGPWLNKLTFRIPSFVIASTLRLNMKRFRMTPLLSQKALTSGLKNLNTIYPFSPVIFKRPTYWPDNVKVLGLLHRQQSNDEVLHADLIRFIEHHKKILMITFGSMTNPNPKKVTQMLLSITQDLMIPTIVNTANGALEVPDVYDHSLVYFTSPISYDLILPHIYAVIHHGGTGTCHYVLKHGCPALIIPHIVDQFHWNNTLSSMGLGPKGIQISKLESSNLLPKIRDLWTNEEYKKAATLAASSMKKENFEEELYQFMIGT